MLCEAGAAILHLPDFYGPYVHVSTLQNALNEAASGKTVNWLGSADTQREYIYVPDAMRIAAAVGARTKAFGGHWCLPGGGPLSGRQAAEIAGRYLGRLVKLPLLSRHRRQARYASGHATATPLRRVMNSRRLMGPPP